nr:hypothetical protein [Tanacetum cinerariifolium]
MMVCVEGCVTEENQSGCVRRKGTAAATVEERRRRPGCHNNPRSTKGWLNHRNDIVAKRYGLMADPHCGPYADPEKPCASFFVFPYTSPNQLPWNTVLGLFQIQKSHMQVSLSFSKLLHKASEKVYCLVVDQPDTTPNWLSDTLVSLINILLNNSLPRLHGVAKKRNTPIVGTYLRVTLGLIKW